MPRRSVISSDPPQLRVPVADFGPPLGTPALINPAARLPRSFFARPVLTVACECIGAILVHRTPDGVTAGRVVESEAYRGPEDLAAHSARGRRTPRTEVMFGPPGHAYMFLLYGMHWAFNIVVGLVGEPHAVLIRAIEPLVGLERMSLRRRMDASRRELTNGPGKLCQALGLTGEAYGIDLCAGEAEKHLVSDVGCGSEVGHGSEVERGSEFGLVEGTAASPPSRELYLVRGLAGAIGVSPRINVDYAGAWAEKPWRFYERGSRYVSVPPRN